MTTGIDAGALQDIVDEAERLSLLLREGEGRRHVPFTLTPCPVSAADFAILNDAAPLLGRLTQAIAARASLIQDVHAPLESGDAFFSALMSLHRQLHAHGEPARLPLLLQRSDFMPDPQFGPGLVECNSIAAGMAPFGERAAQLHAYVAEHFPAEYRDHMTDAAGAPARHRASAAMARAIASAAAQIAGDIGDDGPLNVLMVVQEAEDNIYDQQLLQEQLQALGANTMRRTFRELHGSLSSGPGERLVLDGSTTVHVVYLRAGYRYLDYVATDLDTRRCCDALEDTRLFIERHRVAVNATVAQQLATSKRMQLHLSQHPGELANLGFDPAEQSLLRSIFTPMHAVDGDSATRVRDTGPDNWVLKNQGEGGGHGLFGDDILPALEFLQPGEYGAWTLMRRLRPTGRDTPTILVRQGAAQRTRGLVGEIGVFTAHLGDAALDTSGERPGHIGYLVRSRPPEVTEGGVHSGYGALDSLFVEA